MVQLEVSRKAEDSSDDFPKKKMNKIEEMRHHSMAKLHFKFARIVSRHDQLKASFHQLNSQIKIGLIEAEDVFSSLAIPLMKLVGLKTTEMAEEGKSSIFFMTTDLHTQANCGNNIKSKTPMGSSSAVEGEYESHKLEEDYTTRATVAGKELIQKQKMQLTQLVGLLQQIESCVNSSQDSILQTIDDHKSSINKFFEKAINCVSVIQQSNQNNGSFFITLKLLKATYNHVCAVLRSVEGGVENLINELAEQMCMPMVQYVKSFRAEMITGTCPRLLVALEEMGGAARDGRVELEQARKKVRIEEQRKLDALRRLKESEERIKTMREQLAIFIEAKTESTGHFARKKFLGSQEDQTKDNELLWEMLKKKRKFQQPDNPFGPKELLCMGTNSKQPKSTTRRPAINYRPMTREYTKGLSSKATSLDSWPPLSSSPSVISQQVLSRKRVIP